MKAKDDCSKSEAMQKLLTDRHPAPPHASSTPEIRAGVEAFLAWRAVLDETWLCLPGWAEHLRGNAEANAVAQESAAQRAAMCKWTQWIHDGPADGLRRQHRFSRGVDGWIPSNVSSGNIVATDANDELDDLNGCLLYTSPSPRDKRQSRMPSSA